MLSCLKVVFMIGSALCLFVFATGVLSGDFNLGTTTDSGLLRTAFWSLWLAAGVVFGYLGLKLGAKK
jgi:hypothetical protein